MVDQAHTLNPEDRALWEIPLPAGTPVTIDITRRTNYGYGTTFVNLSLTNHVYYQPGDTATLQGRQAQAILPGGRNDEALTGHITFICAVDAALDLIRE